MTARTHLKVGRGAHVEGEVAVGTLVIERIIRTITNLNATNAALFSMSGLSINSKLAMTVMEGCAGVWVRVRCNQKRSGRSLQLSKFVKHIHAVPYGFLRMIVN